MISILKRQFFFVFFVCILSWVNANTDAETERRLRVSEAAPIGHRIGFATATLPRDVERTNFYVAFPDAESSAEKVLAVNERTGEILLHGHLDHELEKELSVIVIPTNGSPGHKVVIEVLDENDNTPTFPVDNIRLEIAENSRIGTELPLPIANDADSKPFNVREYRITSGNVNNVFRLTSRTFGSLVYVDLVVGGKLDREYRDHYNLLVEAIDGGEPARTGKLNVNIQILDTNDCVPQFVQSRYAARVSSNITIATPILTVSARDEDLGDNARITYKLTQTNRDDVYYYRVDAESGVVSVAVVPLPSGVTHEMLVTAIDHGVPQSLESSVFLSVTVMDEDVNSTSSSLSIKWLTEDGRPVVRENTNIGVVIARVAVNEAFGLNIQLKMNGCESMCLKQADSGFVYLLSICGPLDREVQSFYRLKFLLIDQRDDTIFDHPVHVDIEDENDNPPLWSQPIYRATYNRTDEDEQQPILRLMAIDKDVGENARIRYSLVGTELFEINSETGIISTINPLNCSVGPEVRFRVLAEDRGTPPLSSLVDVVIDITDLDAQPPFFEKSIYELSVKEDVGKSACLLQVKAKDRSCSLNEKPVRYSLRSSNDNEDSIFHLDSESGKLCLTNELDFEIRSRYQLTVFADSQAGKTSSALITIAVEDQNDSIPSFCPTEYNAIIRSGETFISKPILQLRALDEDLGAFGQIRYVFEDVPSSLGFRLQPLTGELYLDKSLATQRPNVTVTDETSIELKINAQDGGGMKSAEPAIVRIFVVGNDTKSCVDFISSPYNFTISEDILPGIIAGTIRTQPANVRMSIEDGNPSGYFKLDERTGRVVVNRELDADHQNFYLLNIKAQNEKLACANYTQVRVVIQDSNDNEPIFDMKTVEVNIPEDYPIHEPFFAVQATDRDRDDNGRVTYELISSEPPCPVIVRAINGQLLLAAPLDFESVQRYSLRIKAQDQGIPPHSSTINVTLNVFDVNDQTPEFSTVLYNFEVIEGTMLMTEIARVHATDRDSGKNGRVRYRLADETMVNDFGVNAISGEIFVRRELDRERQAEYSFLVVATDQGNPPLSANASVHVRVLDLNDNGPDCSTVGKFNLSEEHQHRQLIGTLNATDPDAGLNGTVSYRIQKFHELFDVKPNGQIYVRYKIDPKLMRNSYRLAIIAEDHGRPEPRSAVCHVLIQIEKSPSDVTVLSPIERNIDIDPSCRVGCHLIRINASNVNRWEIEPRSQLASHFDVEDGVIRLSKEFNENETSLYKPSTLIVNIFDSHEQKKQLTFNVKRHHRYTDNSTLLLNVTERTPPGTRLTQIGESSNSSNRVYYELLDRSDFVDIDSLNGALYLTRRLNYSDATFYEVTVAKRAIGGPILNKTAVKFNVLEENLHSPRFDSTAFKFSISENTFVGSKITQIEAFDANGQTTKDNDQSRNSRIVYRIIGDEAYFNVDKSTGEIFLRQTLNYNRQAKHHFVLEASDMPANPNERRSSTCSVVIEVIDENNNSPIFISDKNVTLYMDSFPSNEPVHYFVAIDQDSGLYGQVTYKITSGNNPPAFSVDAQTGALSVLHRPTGLVQLTVRASDSDPIMPRFSDQEFTIFVHQSETKWVYFSQPIYHFTLAADTLVGTLLVDFKRPSFETKSRPKFKLLPQTENNFELNPLNGILKTKKPLRQGAVYRMSVYVSDAENELSDLANVIVHVPNEKSSGPKIAPSTCGIVVVRENKEIPKLTRVIATIDDKESSSIRYQIEGGSGGNYFKINSSNGIISAQQLDRETLMEHILVISASDNHVPRRVDVCTVKVIVSDENDNAPVFDPNTPTTIELNKQHWPGSILLRLEATDLDANENGQVIYKMTDKSGMLDINPTTGLIMFARELPFAGAGWEILVEAQDSGVSSIQRTERRIQIQWKRASITASQVNGVQFLRRNQTVVIAEGEPSGKFVAQLETTDRPSSATTRVHYRIVSGNTDEAFEIDDLGTLKTTQELDAEKQSIYRLEIRGEQTSKGAPETSITIRVLNVNDSPPSFPQNFHRRIEEDTPVGLLIASVNTRDADRDRFVEYSLNPPNSNFDLHPFSGELFLAASLDYETKKQHLLRVQAFDGEHTTFANLTIEVLDINDNNPTFTSDLFEFTFSSNAPIPGEVGQVTAIDEDSGDFGHIHYVLHDADGLMRINSESGVVTLLRKLHIKEEHFVTVEAIDRGTPALRSFSTVYISGMRKKSTPDAPVFEQANYTFLVSEDFPVHLPFARLNVKNQTTGWLRFLIEDPKMAAIFRVDGYGRVSLKQSLDYEQQITYHVTLSVRNSFATTRYQAASTALLVVNVGDVNDHEPIFDSMLVNAPIRIDERTKKGTRLRTIRATDADGSENGRVRYFLIAGDEHATLTIDSLTGALFFERWHGDLLADTMDLLRPRRSVIVMAEDGGQPSRWTTIELTIETNIANWSFSAPFFPLPVYTAFVFESVRNGTIILRSQATNKIGNSNGLNWRYSIVNNDEVFTINSVGEISICGQLDYEKRSDYEFLVSVTDNQERSAIATVFVHVIGVDEFAPIFNRPSYSFQIPWTATVGQQVGKVQATDSDLGPNGGVVKYSLQDSLLKSIQIDSDSGILSIRERLNRTENRTIEQVIVMAASGPIQLSRVPVELEFSDSAVLYVDENASTIIVDRLIFGTICGVGFGLLTFCLLTCIFYIRKRDRKRKPRKQIFSVARGNLAVMTDVRRLSPTYSKSHFSSPSATIIPTTYSVASSSTSAIADERTAIQSGNESRVRMRDETVLLNRSQPDSGIDADVLSIGSGITEYLNQMSKQSAIPHSTADPLDIELLSGYYIDSCDTEKITEMSLNAYLRPTSGIVRTSNQRPSQYTQMSSTFKERSQ